MWILQHLRQRLGANSIPIWGELEVPVTRENGELSSFPEPVEAMGTVDSEDAFYSSAIVEGFEIVIASFENSSATVRYTMDDEVVTEVDQIAFTRAMQLAAFDFDAGGVRLVNDTLQKILTYSLAGQERSR